MAVKLSVALPDLLVEAATIGTLKLLWPTRGVFTFRRLIRAIGTVGVMITHKVLRDTLSVLAHELVLITGVVGVHAASLDALIRSIVTVLIAIAFPSLRHAHVGARTLESLRAAGLRLALMVFV